MRRAEHAWALLLLVCGLGGLAGAAAGQMPVDAAHARIPPLPTGEASLRGRIVHRSDPARATGVPIRLYALQPDGLPGLGHAKADAAGQFAFEGISNEHGIVYIVDARYDDVAFRQRVVFEPGQQTVEIEILVAEATSDASRIRIDESLVRLDWAGSRLLISQSYRLRNEGDDVVRIGAEARRGSRAAFRGELPEGASDFSDVKNGLGEGLVREKRSLRFWGPVYPGEQELRYHYTLPIPDTDGEPVPISLDLRLPDGSAQVTILFPEEGLQVRGPGFSAGEPVEIGGQRYRSLGHGAVAPGTRLALTVEVPESRDDPDAISISQADIWLDLDDTQVVARVEWAIQIAPPARLRAGPGRALLSFPLPEGAEVLGISPEAVAAGLALSADSRALELVGPLLPGPLEVTYRYRLPATTAGLDLDLDFPRAVAVLNLLVADNGIAIENDRLHRRRPFRSGTRLYLHREAFQVAEGEILAVGLRPLHQSSLPRPVAIAAALGLALVGAGFLVTPLRQRAIHEEPEQARSERESVYESIRDLDHDFETGKLEAADYESMGDELRAKAVALLREERARADAPVELETTESEVSRCPTCGSAAQSAWRFCSHCGAGLA